METITITKANAQAAYAQAPSEFKETLRLLLGGKLHRDPFEFKNYEELCESIGIDPVASLPYPQPATKKELSVNGAFKLETIFEVFNCNDDGSQWEADYANKSQAKWYPWHEWSAASGSFVFTYTCFTGTFTYLGARLCTNTDAKAAHIGKVFNKEWNEFLNPQI